MYDEAVGREAVVNYRERPTMKSMQGDWFANNSGDFFDVDVFEVHRRPAIVIL